MPAGSVSMPTITPPQEDVDHDGHDDHIELTSGIEGYLLVVEDAAA